jgi:hypothetical protein
LACGLGGAAGAAFAWLWLLVVPHATHLRFWSATHALTREIFQVDGFGPLVSAYRRLFLLVGGYVARNLGGTLLAALPALALLFLLNGKSEAVFAVAFAVTLFAAFLWPARS